MVWWVPILAALAANSAKNVATGKPVLKNSLQAGVIGGLTGGMGAAAGGAAAGAGSAAGGAAAGAGSAAATTGATSAGAGGLLGSTSASGLSSGLSTSIPSATSSIIPGSIESSGMTNVGGTFYNPDYFVGESVGNPIYTGGEGLLSNAGSELKSMVGNISPQNLQGVASLLSPQQDTGQYQQMAGTGGVSKGNGGLAVQMPQAKVFKRRKA
jgi:hypothetical protein